MEYVDSCQSQIKCHLGWLCASLRLDSCLALYSLFLFCFCWENAEGRSRVSSCQARHSNPPLLVPTQNLVVPTQRKEYPFSTYPPTSFAFLVISLFFTQCVNMFPPFQEWLACSQLLCNPLPYFAAIFELGVWQVSVVKFHRLCENVCLGNRMSWEDSGSPFILFFLGGGFCLATKFEEDGRGY